MKNIKITLKINKLNIKMEGQKLNVYILDIKPHGVEKKNQQIS